MSLVLLPSLIGLCEESQWYFGSLLVDPRLKGLLADVVGHSVEGLSRDDVNDQIDLADFVDSGLCVLSFAQAGLVGDLLHPQFLKQIVVVLARVDHPCLEVSDAVEALLLVGVKVQSGFAALLFLVLLFDRAVLAF